MKNINQTAEDRATYQIAILKERQVRKFISFLESLGAKEWVDNQKIKIIQDVDHEVIFSSEKIKASLWKCKVHSLLVNQFIQTCA